MEPEPDLPTKFYSFFLFFPLLISINWGLSFAFVLVIFLLFCSALISGSEVAYFSLTSNHIKDLQSENGTTNQRIIKLKEDPRKLLATILISNNFVNVAIVIVSDYIVRQLFPDSVFRNWAEGIYRFTANFVSVDQLVRTLQLLITVGGVTFLLVLFGEVAPKLYAKLNNVKLAKLMSRPLSGLSRFFNPLSTVLINGTNFIEKRLEKRTSANITSREDIDKAIELAVSNDKDSEQEIDILKSLVKFGDVSVKQIMRPRVDVVAVDFQFGFRELLKVVRKSGFSRIPVYNDDFDNVVGILYVKDLLGHLNEDKNFEWQALIHTNVLYVPESKKIDDLLREFQSEKLHMSIVVDEYGGSAGIVTLEDILEEVIGEIKDEFDNELLELDFEKIDDYNYVFEGKTLLNDLCRVTGLDTTTFDEVKGDADSVAGLILEILGQIPRKGVEVAHGDYKFKIVAVNTRRIEQIQITLPYQ